MLQKAPSPGHGDAEGPTNLGVGARLLAHGVQVGDAAAEVEDASPGQRQLHGVDVGLLGRGGCPLHGGEAAGCGRAGTELGPHTHPHHHPIAQGSWPKHTQGTVTVFVQGKRAIGRHRELKVNRR